MIKQIYTAKFHTLVFVGVAYLRRYQNIDSCIAYSQWQTFYINQKRARVL